MLSVVLTDCQMATTARMIVTRPREASVPPQGPYLGNQVGFSSSLPQPLRLVGVMPGRTCRYRATSIKPVIPHHRPELVAYLQQHFPETQCACSCAIDGFERRVVLVANGFG